MASTHKNQRGFSTVEGVLVVVALALIGFVGWYVYHTRQNSNKALDAANNTSNSAGPRFTSNSKAADSGSTSNSSLQSDLSSAASASNQGSKDMSATNDSLNDQSTLTSIPQ